MKKQKGRPVSIYLKDPEIITYLNLLPSEEKQNFLRRAVALYFKWKTKTKKENKLERIETKLEEILNRLSSGVVLPSNTIPINEKKAEADGFDDDFAALNDMADID